MLYLKKIGTKFFATLALATASLGFEASLAAATPISSGEGYAQYSLDQVPINPLWRQFTSTLIRNQLQIAFRFEFPTMDDFTYQTRRDKLTFYGSQEEKTKHLLFAKPLKSHHGVGHNWDHLLRKALKPYIHHKDGSQIGDQKFTDILINDSPARQLELTWWNPIECRITLVTLLTDGYDLFGVVSSFDEYSHLQQQEATHKRIAESIQLLN